MTRIIAGEWRGHPLPKLKTGSVRPTTDRARTILFDTLRDVMDMHVLDLYSGTGALGFEALSRGAVSLTSIDRDSKYIHEQKLWMTNRDRLFKAYVGDVQGILRKLDHKFDLILADPPYAEQLSEKLIHLIETHAAENAYFVYESARNNESTLDSDVFKLLKEKVVAETKIRIYKAN
ncbi:MAG: RsmD family RNA methyltransferase [Candidatus Marinimicrobia bacterium]|nr:RsmD family RNA methyltransferase [Candidatus Neomarinimicrobiota bacterium]